MHSVIFHKLDFINSNWVIETGKPFSLHRVKQNPITISCDTGSIKFWDEGQSKSFLDDRILEIGKRIASDTLSLPRESFGPVLASRGGWWYKFKSFDEKLVTYIRQSQSIVVLEVGGNIVTVVFNEGVEYESKNIDNNFCPCNTIGRKEIGSNVYTFMTEPGQRKSALDEIKSHTRRGKHISVIDPYMLGTITGKCEINDKLINIAKGKGIPQVVLEMLSDEKGRSFSSVDKFMVYIKRRTSSSRSNYELLSKIATDVYIKNCYVSDFMKAISSKSIDRVNILYSSKHSDDTKVRQEIVSKLGNKAKFYDLDTLDDIFIHDRIWVIDSEEALVVGNSFGGLGMDAISFILPLPPKDLLKLKNVLSPHGIKI